MAMAKVYAFRSIFSCFLFVLLVFSGWHRTNTVGHLNSTVSWYREFRVHPRPGSPFTARGIRRNIRDLVVNSFVVFATALRTQSFAR